jgi:hypothetical protein
MPKRERPVLPVIGWREWVALPDFGIAAIKVKVDTGARSSSLHVSQLRIVERDNVKYAQFKIHPVQRTNTPTLNAEARVLEVRSIRSSSGKASMRPVIITNIEMLGLCFPVELTLASRDEMGFRMLLGREAFRQRFLVDAGRSYYGDRPKFRKKAKNL